MGVIHRDIKPGNLILLDDGTIKVTDFGIAHAANSASITAVGQVIGTAMYLSPEQASGVTATPASDIYSLGVVGYEMLTGQPPFTADNPAALAMAHLYEAPRPLPATVPPAVRAAIGGALSKDPTLRPRDARTFAAELRRLQSTTFDPTAASSIDGAGGHAATRLMSNHAGQFRTEIMPPGRIVGRAEDLGLAREVYASRRQRRWIAAAAIAVVVVGIVLVQLGAFGRSRLVDGQKTTVTTVANVAVDPKALIGVPVAAASDALSKAGLLVTIHYTDAAGTPKGVVTGVEPIGEVRSGSTVVLDVSNGSVPSTTAPVATTAPGKGKGNKAHGKPKG
jgi:serine/threonine-protein kinase